MKTKYIYIKLLSFYKGLIGLFAKGLLVNYCIEKNAGDLFNYDFIEKKYSRVVRKYSFGRKEHYLFCGSILGRSNKYSIILGAGFISKEQSEDQVYFRKAIGVRGELTAKALKKYEPYLNFKFLGDPGLLAREIIAPRDNSYLKSNIIGVIPHFIDMKIVKDLIGNSQDFIIIDIRDNFENVCEKILKCDAILSSSLHGLIFSDSMNVPNVWVKFSDNIKGGSFKFHDYYSVMEFPKKNYIKCSNLKDMKEAILNVSVCSNPRYKEMKNVIDMEFK